MKVAFTQVLWIKSCSSDCHCLCAGWPLRASSGRVLLKETSHVRTNLIDLDTSGEAAGVPRMDAGYLLVNLLGGSPITYMSADGRVDALFVLPSSSCLA